MTAANRARTTPREPARATFRQLRARRGAGARELRALDRDARTPRLVDTPVADAGAALRAQRVVVVGLGSVGSHAADLLARASVATLALVDRDRIGPESVLTHPVHPRDIGRPKATLAGERAKAVSPATRVLVHDGPVEELPLGALAGATAVLLAPDNHACELEVGRRCLQLGVPLIQASVHGPTLVAQVRSLGHRAGGDAACLACGYQAADWEALDRGTRYPCAGGPALANAAPTVSPAQLCSTAASLAVTELLGRCAGLVPRAASRLVEYCGFGHRTSVTPLVRRPDCPLDHSIWRVVAWKHRLARATPRELFAAAGYGDSLKGERALVGVALTVAGHRFGGLGYCDCTPHPVLERFRPAGAEAAPCPACGAALELHPFTAHEVVPGSALRAQLDRTLEELGARAPDAVLVRGADRSVLFHARRGVAR